METRVDDVGSFPLPDYVDRETFDKAYAAAKEAIRNREKLSGNRLLETFNRVILESFKKKLRAGLDVANYPQQYDGMKQVGEEIRKAMEKGTFIVDNKDAILPEVYVIAEQAKNLSEEFGRQISLRVSMFGPMEQYLKEVGTTAYGDVLDGFAETIRRFAKNSILNSKYIRTEVVSIDEPSFGFLTINASKEELGAVLQKAFDFQGATRQIHLHSSVSLPDLLTVKNIDVLTFEYAASPKNIESVSKKILEEADKNIRVGISRTDIDAITAEIRDRALKNPAAEQLVETEATIRKRYILAKQKFGERMTFTGPDCGLGGWPSQETAQMLLERTVKAVKSAEF